MLVVEDEIYSRKSLVKQIRQFDAEGQFVVLEASNGKKALDMALSEQPELVLSDIKMPFMNGLELLKELHTHAPDTKVMMISGYADFQFAQEALNQGAIGYLLKPVSDEMLQDGLQRFLEQKAQRHKEQEEKSTTDQLTEYLLRSISEGYIEEDFVLEKTFSRVLAPYRLMSITFLDGSYPKRSEFQKRLKGLLEQSLDVDFRIVVLSNRRWEVAFKNTPSLSGVLRRLGGFLDELGFYYTVGVSGLHRQSEELPTAHAEALNAEKYRLVEEGNLFSFDRLRQTRTVSCASLPCYDELKLQLEQGNAGSAYALMQQTLLQMRENHALMIESYETLLMKLQVLLCDLSDESKNQLEQQWFSLLHYTRFDALLDDVKQRLDAVCKEVLARKEHTEESIPDRVIEYIQQNYNKDLSLKDLAERVFFMNHSYLSYLIREKTGKTYSSFLREIRIRHAKELLTDSHLSITDVATLSGYNDPSQFIQTFKKEVGMTPRRFREQSVKSGRPD